MQSHGERPPCCGFLSLRLEEQKQCVIAEKDSAPMLTYLGLELVSTWLMLHARCLGNAAFT